jgi:hypothetical protein
LYIYRLQMGHGGQIPSSPSSSSMTALRLRKFRLAHTGRSGARTCLPMSPKESVTLLNIQDSSYFRSIRYPKWFLQGSEREESWQSTVWQKAEETLLKISHQLQNWSNLLHPAWCLSHGVDCIRVTSSRAQPSSRIARLRSTWHVLANAGVKVEKPVTLETSSWGFQFGSMLAANSCFFSPNKILLLSCH